MECGTWPTRHFTVVKVQWSRLGLASAGCFGFSLLTSSNEEDQGPDEIKGPNFLHMPPEIMFDRNAGVLEKVKESR